MEFRVRKHIEVAGLLFKLLALLPIADQIELGGNASFFTLVAGSMFAVFVSLSLIRRHIPGSPSSVSGTLVTSPSTS